ncbi:MAG TPA: TrmH family RNA methyltransferase, partial [Acidimicrobiales bacterium]|nr:TrmH family RNA methyltransferase [Acidimicrobiales bacterium]
EVLALTPTAGAEDIRSLAPRPRRALLVGAEGPGLSPRALAGADRRVRIAMAPGADSLNVATAAAVALHHLRGLG